MASTGLNYFERKPQDSADITVGYEGDDSEVEVRSIVIRATRLGPLRSRAPRHTEQSTTVLFSSPACMECHLTCMSCVSLKCNYLMRAHWHTLFRHWLLDSDVDDK